MKKAQIRWGLGIAVLVAGAIGIVSCGGGTAMVNRPMAGSAAVLFFAKDAPCDNVVAFEVTLTSITLDPGQSTQFEALAQPVEVELESLQMGQALLRLAASVPAANYTSVRLLFSNAEVKLFDASAPNSIREINLPNPPPVTKSGNFTVVANTPVGLQMDFNLCAALVGEPPTSVDFNRTDAGGQPALTVSLLSLAAADDEFEEEGRVVSVSPSASDPNAGTFVLEPFQSCQQVTVTVNAQTQFEDFPNSRYSDLQANQFVDVDADVLPNGTILATELAREEPDNDD